ncbi:MAG: sulfatase-like hydrolase/transferase [Propionicimonas sp.]|nr:sulfatase-like hydrolase/transferase [Propionicimonas sp.]
MKSVTTGDQQPRQKTPWGLWVLATLALILIATAGWIRYRFGSVVLEQVILHLPLHGEGTGSDNLMVEAVGVCILAPLGLVALVAALVQRRLTGRTRPLPRRRLVAAATAGTAISLGVLLTVVGVPQFAAAQLDGRTFAPYYVTPRTGTLPAHPKNLSTIYLESRENTFSDTELFGHNLLAPLDEATADWARYDGLQQYPGGGWTMAGVVSTECGLPLKSRLLVGGVDPNIFGEQAEEYLPSATCLGDLLANAGYTSIYLGGANTRFAGKDTFLKNHGYDAVQGREVWERSGEDPANISIWGLSDARLFSHARDTVDELRAAGEPFSLTMLTLDTHEPPGLYSSCSTADTDPMATAITCSMRAVAGFLDYLKDSGALADTVVVVMGDHLKATAEGGSFKAELDGTADRTIVLRVWSPEPVQFARPRADQFSMLATSLDLLGLLPSDGRAGLGVSLLHDYPLTCTALELPEDQYQETVTSPSSDLYKELWATPQH